MRAAVIGLGVEGKKATNSLLKYNWDVYATDSNVNINLDGLDIPLVNSDLTGKNQSFSIFTDNLVLDIGFLNKKEIESCDTIVISPSMWGSSIANDLISQKKLISDFLTKHKDIFTIGITGTNGKTTTVHMLKSILEDAGFSVLVGGNGGGGFNGYYDLILESENNDYDILLVEVCDMTLDFANYCFDFDLIGLTNMGNDHMNVHGTIANYKNSLVRFFNDKDIIIGLNQDFKSDFKDSARSYTNFFESQIDLKVFGKFNRLNAGLATAIARKLKIPLSIIENSLGNFKAVNGRLDIYKINNAKIYIGKTDNKDALLSVLKEDNFYAIFMGTPRFIEQDRLNMLEDVVDYNPEVIVLFEGLDDTIDLAISKLHSLGYNGRIEIATSLNDIINFVAEFSHENAIFIGGNGQDTIIDIQERIKLISQNL